jgi:colanic acid biosynthesis glycosyl transferase WcaI
VELFLYGKSARVIALTDAFKRNLVSRGIPPSKIEVVKNGVDLSFFNPHLASPGLIQELQVNSRFVASYIGTVGMAHAVEKIVEVAERLKGVPEILFLVVGEGANKEKIQNLVSQKGLSNIKILPGVSKDRVRDYYAVTDLNLVTLRNTKLFRTVIPSKIFEIMAMGRPILCSVDGECRKIVEQAGSGVYVEPENVEQMAQVVQNLSRGNDVLLTMGQNGRRFVEAYFDRDNLAATYLTLLRQVSRVSI